MTIPNIITILRLAAVPFIIYSVIVNWHELAFWLFIVAGISDAVDGFIAKRFNQSSQLGAYLDPLADKALIVSLFVTLGIQGHIPIWLTLLVVSRDVFILCGIGVAGLMENPIDIDPLRISKVNTAFQIALVCLVLAAIGFDLSVGILVKAGTFIVASLTIASAIAYLLTWIRHLSDHEDTV